MGNEHLPSLIDTLLDAASERDNIAMRHLIESVHPADVAAALEGMPKSLRRTLWEQITGELQGEILIELGDDARASILSEMAPSEIAEAANELEADELADIVEQLPTTQQESVLAEVSPQLRDSLRVNLTYAEDSAGRLMSGDAIAIRSDMRLEAVARFLRRQGYLPDHTDCLMVVDREGALLGRLPLEALLLRDPHSTVDEWMECDIDQVTGDMPENEVARLFERHDLISVPVVDDYGILVGRITVDDIVDVLRSEADGAYMQRVGLDGEEDLFAPVWLSARRRATWLGINLLTAILAAWVIGQFQETLEHLVALAVLMPIVASMGGIAGSQTLTLTIRGLAMGQLAEGNRGALMSKEVCVSILNGLLWATAVALVAVVWFRDWGIGGVIALAVGANMLCASVAGVAIPLALKRMGSDPALSGAVVLTTVTDVVGFLSFLGLATLLLT